MTDLERLEKELSQVEAALAVASRSRDLSWIQDLREQRETLFGLISAEGIKQAKARSPYVRVVDDVPGLYGKSVEVFDGSP